MVLVNQGIYRVEVNLAYNHPGGLILPRQGMSSPEGIFGLLPEQIFIYSL